MLEVKLQGRGGQGVVLATQILARAFLLKGAYPQCYSLFGAERRWAPVTSFLRVDDEKVLLRCEIKRPDHMIVMASDLIDQEEIGAALKPQGLVLINAPLSIDGLGGLRCFALVLVDAGAVAQEVGLGRTINTAVLGAYCRANSDLSLDLLERAIRESVPGSVEANIEAARKAYKATEVFPPAV
jgi:2-oxoacid:acceptor oxidoreductase gamma subunit (pyruvate/2-ketoisovalerate family)